MPNLGADGLIQALADFVAMPLVQTALNMLLGIGVGAFLLSRIVDAFRR